MISACYITIFSIAWVEKKYAINLDTIIHFTEPECSTFKEKNVLEFFINLFTDKNQWIKKYG